jgi:eukaryotic-like serine/threonine-protein kinase
MRSFAYNHPLMALTSGTKLGPYQILSSIGAGGMGEVYRARDSRLSRDVAIKVLPASFSADPDRLQRFAQECRATAALNHPNILSIFDIGENLAAPYVVSELLEGENLRDRLREGPIPARKAIDYAKQIASGLAAAHEKGITHRDLKPENLFITIDGRIKILDFGLAKLTRPEPDDSGDAPTQQIATDAGTVMGTVGYMAPEQVRGKPADARSDIFAFGAILYEMLSGKRAFHGDSPVDTMSAILKEDPPDLTETNRSVPSALERIVRHCLEKNPAERFQSARDLAFNLDALSELSTSRSGAQPLPVEKERATRRSLTIAVASVLLLASWVAIYLFAHRRAPTNPTFHEITFRNGTIWDARFAPDGQTIVYGANWEGNPAELFTTRFDGTDSRSVGLPSSQILSISSKGEMAISLHAAPYSAFSMKGTLARVPLVGGAPREVLDSVAWADWGPDGDSFAVIRPTGGGGDDLEYPIGNVIYSPQAWVSHVRFSPNGEYLAIADHVPSGDDGRIVVIDKHGNHITSSSFFTSVQGLAWGPNGKEVWFSAVPNGAARSLYALDLSGKERLIYRAPGGVTIHDISPSGLVLLTADKVRLGMLALAPGETHERSLSWFDWSLLLDLSADGKTLLFSESGEATGNGSGAIFLRNTDGSPAVRLGEGGFGKLSPDGKWAVVEIGHPAKVVLLPTGAGQSRQLTDDKLDHFNARWLADNKTIFFSANEPGKPARSYLLDVETPGAAPRPITPEDVVVLFATPDGKFLLAANRKHERWLFPVDGSSPQKLNLDIEGDEIALGFIENGKGLLLRTRGLPLNITRLDMATGKRTPFKVIVPSDPAGAQSIPAIHFSADGKSYAYSLGRWLSDLYVVDGLK